MSTVEDQATPTGANEPDKDKNKQTAEKPTSEETPGQRGGEIDHETSEDPVQEASEESFPSSDPPSFTPTTGS